MAKPEKRFFVMAITALPRLSRYSPNRAWRMDGDRLDSRLFAPRRLAPSVLKTR
jgi:hypothetical protein